jgi:DNA repair exonuclease SbcCD ATPase subunit
MKLNSIEDLNKSLSSKNLEITEMKNRKKIISDNEKNLLSAKSKIEFNIENINKMIADKEKIGKEYNLKSVKENEDKAKMLQEQIQILESENARLIFLIKENKKWIEELKKHSEKCPICKNDLTEKRTNELISEKELQNINAISEDEKIKITLADKKEELEKLINIRNKFKIAESQIKEYENKDLDIAGKKIILDKLALKLSNLKEENERTTDSIEKLQSDIEQLNTNKDNLLRKIKYENDLNDSLIQINNKEKELSEIFVDEKIIESTEHEFISITSRISKLRADKEANEKYLKEKKNQIDDKDTEIKLIDKIYSEIKINKMIAENIIKFKDSIDETKSALRNKLISSINSVLEEIWPNLYPYTDYSLIMLDPAPDDYILKAMIEKDGVNEWKDIEVVASGGERSTACLALRIAFALVLVPNLRWIILDEPTHNIDQEGIGRFVKMFNENLPKMIDQIFIITHDDLLKQASSSKTYLLTRDKSGNGSTVIQQI